MRRSVLAVLAAAVVAVGGGTAQGADTPLVFPVGPDPSAVAAGDVNGDGVADVIVANGNGTLTALFASGRPGFGPPQTLNLNAPPGRSSLATADFNGDNLADIVVGAQGEILVEFGSRTGLVSPRAVATGLSNVDVATGTAAGDAFPDIFVATPNGLVELGGDGKGSFTRMSLPPLPQGFHPVSVAFGRLDNDPIGDLVVLKELGTSDVFNIAVLTGMGDGTFGSPVLLGELSVDPSVFMVGGDNFVLGADGNVYVLASHGIRAFQNQSAAAGHHQLGPEQSLSVGAGTVGVLAVDVNGDNRQDVVALNRGSGTVSTFVASAPTASGLSFSSPVTSLVGANPVTLTPLEFNGDGKADLAVVNASASPGGVGQVSILLGTGTGVFTPATAPACPAITLAPDRLPAGKAKRGYSQALTASGGRSPYTFTRASGSLPTGLALSTAGRLAGTPRRAGTSSFAVQATDADGCTGTRQYSLRVRR